MKENPAASLFFPNFFQNKSLYHEPHGTDVFGRGHRRTSLTQIVSQIRAITVKLVINSSKGWSIIMKGQLKSVITLLLA
ncbi:hypothetical protein EVAR_10627_1 [Eumeta japonica]|uniref:Uncharacterized protein n=1 Tax=Eumeta variegata TaxID=151549 RepID=A0A4C1U224_EUMVA|nr:hypothetical protein EVAR_10627_1 [Eumeta japonica]